MHLSPLKLLTIVCESELEKALLKDLDALGAHGYTVTDARGRGDRGVRDAAWSASSNIRVEVLCPEDTALRIAEEVSRRYYQHYAVVQWLCDAQVLRPQKF